jgi:hypothetical protein
MFSLYSKLAAAIVLALFLAGLYWRGHTQGYKARDAIAQVEEAQRTAQALEASEAARKVEQELSRQVETERQKYAQQLKNTRTVAAAAGIGMRDLQQALAGPVAAASASAAARADDAARARIVVSACAREVQAMAALLDERNQQLIALQAYVRDVALAKPPH